MDTFRDFSEFKAKLSGFSKKAKGDAFEELTLAYLKLEPRYATLLKTIWPLRQVPAQIREQLNLPPTDEGIDFVAETFDGKFWAIQSKYKEDASATLGLADLGTFTSLTFITCRDKFDFALVVTTASRLSSKFIKNYGNQIGQVTYQDWQELDDGFFQNLRHLEDKKYTPPPQRIPRPHQQRAINAAVEHFIEENNVKGKLSHPCASGKSLTGYWIADQLKAKTVLVAVPSLALVRQAIKDYLKETFATGRTANWIAVCSDDMKELDDGDSSTLPQDLGIKIHTKVDDIAAWLRQSHHERTYVFSTYQSGRAIAEASRLAEVEFDLGIFDEAHRTVGKKDTLFSHLLFDENINITRRVFMTATERHYQGSSEHFVSMRDPDVYGETFDSLSFKEALESNPPILCDYKIVTMVVTRDEIDHLIENNLYVKPDKGKWDDEVEAQMLASAVALRKVMQKNPIKHAVSFHGSIARARAFQKTQDLLTQSMPSFGGLETFHVTGATPTAKRSRELERFVQSGCSLITNARCLTEGVDVPDIDCVLFADPRRSTVDIVQAVGRALRRAEGKEYGYVVIPVLIDADADENDQYSAFEPVLMVLRALGANDDRIIEYFRSRSEGRKAGRAMPDMIDMPDHVNIDVGQFIESIELQFWSRLAKLSWRPFEEARAFVRSLNLKNVEEWRLYCKGELPGFERIPNDIPKTPYKSYSTQGWIDFGDWLETQRLSNNFREFLPFEEARKYVQSLHLKSGSEWRDFCAGRLPDKGLRPQNIPSNPNCVYKSVGWIGMPDWLGSKTFSTRHRKYRLFKDARLFARTLNLSSCEEWRAFCRGQLPEKGSLPNDIPAKPDNTYKDQGWIGVQDWLGYKSKGDRYRSFEKAKAFARKLKLNSEYGWRQYCEVEKEKGSFPEDIPKYPQNIYRGQGWEGFQDWLGYKAQPKRNQIMRPFKEAKRFVRSLNLRSSSEWRLYCKGELLGQEKKPDNIPSNPHRTYKSLGWKSMGDWLGTEKVATYRRQYRPFYEARSFVHSLKLSSSSEWAKFCKGQIPEKGALPEDIPVAAKSVYAKDGWVGMGDWLGTGRVATFKKEYRTFEEARRFAQSLNLKSKDEWIRFCQGKFPERGILPEDVPTNARQTYLDSGWVSWPDWLGTT